MSKDPSSSLLRIAVVGPESTGKSVMAQYLAEQLDTVAVPEYARYYCEGLERNYTLADEMAMFRGQWALENALKPFAQDNILICDTMVLTIKVWCDHLFGETPAEVLHSVLQKPYDYYLLMDIDLPWVDDPLRDFPDQRAHFMAIWHQELKELNAPYQVISGIGEDRLKAGLNAVRYFLQSR
jgi:NadR type nicotinamide-nucleotide adenylyltransferase